MRAIAIVGWLGIVGALLVWQGLGLVRGPSGRPSRILPALHNGAARTTPSSDEQMPAEPEPEAEQEELGER
jgi:hypothetical protein